MPAAPLVTTTTISQPLPICRPRRRKASRKTRRKRLRRVANGHAFLVMVMPSRNASGWLGCSINIKPSRLKRRPPCCTVTNSQRLRSLTLLGKSHTLHGQTLTPFGPPPGQHCLAALAAATHQKTMGTGALQVTWLISTFHVNNPKFINKNSLNKPAPAVAIIYNSASGKHGKQAKYLTTPQGCCQ